MGLSKVIWSVMKSKQVVDSLIHIGIFTHSYPDHIHADTYYHVDWLRNQINRAGELSINGWYVHDATR